MKVAGGLYLELCEAPAWHRWFGSGGRAAAAVSDLSPGTELHSYCAPENVALGRRAMDAYGVRFIASDTEDSVAFAYFHPLSRPCIVPPRSKLKKAGPLQVSGEVVLRFGFLEGEAIIDARSAVHDPQGGAETESFGANGSRAEHLAVVLNEDEVRLATRKDDIHMAALEVMSREGADVLVVKGGAKGALVFEGGAVSEVPAYLSSRVFKIGTGDVFSAAFAHYWAEATISPAQAADLASRSVAWYCESGRLPLPHAADLMGSPPIPRGTPGSVRVLGDRVTLGQKWVYEEAKSCLRLLGALIWDTQAPSPDAALVLADRPTDDLDEIAVLRAQGVPVVVFGEGLGSGQRAEFERLGCAHIDDFTSAIYRAVWAATR